MIYDIEKTYAENVLSGPNFKGNIPKRPSAKPIDFLGYKVNSPIGVPAGPLLTSAWIELAGKLGFDVPTYKTIRSKAYASHSLPNVTYVNDCGIQTPKPQKISEITITNSFGMPSQSPEFLMQDIEKANRSLGTGQVMIVSIVGTPLPSTSFIDDFVNTALLAKSAGAKIIEANFSCPNVEKKDGILYMNPETVEEYTRKIAHVIGPIPLILKVGAFPNAQQLKNTFLAAAKGGAQGVCGLNSVSMPISPPLDSARPTSGVCGAAIRKTALQFINDAARVIKEEKLDLTLVGCGGIMEKEHFQQFLDAGAQIAMSATGMMWNPNLAMEYHEYTLSHS